MAAFVAKQMVGSKLNAVKAYQINGGSVLQGEYRKLVYQYDKYLNLHGAVGTEDEGTSEDKEGADEEERERLEALREAEERRQEKHRKMEEEREKMRQEIRDKYGIKKKEEVQEPDPFADMGEGGGLNRKRKTPEEIAAEAAAEDQDEFTKLKNTLETQVSELKSTIEGKCLLQ